MFSKVNKSSVHILFSAFANKFIFAEIADIHVPKSNYKILLFFRSKTRVAKIPTLRDTKHWKKEIVVLRLCDYPKFIDWLVLKLEEH